MAKINATVDGMFRAGQISPKEWARLHPNEHGGGKGSQKSKMANFEEKTKNEGAGRLRGPKAVGHIDNRQTMGNAAHAGGKAPFGGMASKGPTPKVGHIDQKQKPMWPKGGGKKGHPVKGGTTNPVNPPSGKNYYGGPTRRQAPARV